MQVRTMHTNERATQVRLLRQLFFFTHWISGMVPCQKCYSPRTGTRCCPCDFKWNKFVYQTDTNVGRKHQYGRKPASPVNVLQTIPQPRGVCGPIGRIRIRTYAPNDFHRTAAVVKNVNYCSRSPLSDGIVLLPQSTMLFPPKIPGVLRQSYEYVARTDSEGVQGPRRQRRRCLGTTSRKFEQRG